MSQFWTAVPEGGGKAELDTALKNTVLVESLKKIREGEQAFFWFDTKCKGESSSHPHLRLPGFNGNVQTSFKNALQVTLDLLGTRQLPHNLHVVFLDGWRQLDNHLQPLFVNSEAEAIKKNRTQLWNYYSEKALRQRRPSKGLVPQMEGLHVFSATSLPVTDKPRLLYEGTCRGTTVGPIAVSQYDSQDVWKLAPGDKKAMLGKAGKILSSGGLTEGDPTTPKPCLGGLEPATFFGMPREYYAEIIHSFNVGFIINGAESDGLLALQCLLAQRPCISICLTAEHVSLLRGRVLELTWAEMTNPKSSIYEAKMSFGCMVSCLLCPLLLISCLFHAMQAQGEDRGSHPGRKGGGSCREGGQKQGQEQDQEGQGKGERRQGRPRPREGQQSAGGGGKNSAG